MANLDYLNVEKIAFLMQLGHSVNLAQWERLRQDQQHDYLRSLGWGFDSAWDFSHAESRAELEVAALCRAAELSHSKGYSSEANKVCNSISRDYQKKFSQEESQRLEKKFQNWLDNFVREIVASAIPGESQKIWKSGQGFGVKK